MRPANHRVHTALLVLALLISARASVAQVATSFEVGLPMVGPSQTSLALLLVGFRVASIKPFAPGVDWSIAVVPIALVYGLVLAKSDLDLTYPIPLGGGATLTPRAGASALVLGGFAAPGGEAVPGYNVGVGFVARTGAKTAVRLDIARDWFREYGGLSILTIGFAKQR